MKSSIVHLLGTLVLVTFLLVCAAPVETVTARSSVWQIETVDKDAGCGDVCLALDSQGRPHISYYGSDNTLHYAYYDGTGWQQVNVDASSGVGEFNALALDHSDHAHIGYYDKTNGDLKYAFYDGATWQLQVVDSAGNVGEYTAIALDALGRPHLTYHDAPKDCLKYASYDGMVWQTETVAPRGFWPSLSLDKAGQAHVSFGTGDSLMYASRDGTAWQVETVDDRGMVGANTSLSLDAFSHPHISCCRFDSYTCDSLEYAYYDGSIWQTEILTAVHDAYLTGANSSLDLDSANRPHIVSGWDASYAWYDGTEWQAEVVDGAAVGDLSMVLDPANRPHISFRYHDILQYAHRTAPSVLPETGREFSLLWLLALALVSITAGVIWRLRSERGL